MVYDRSAKKLSLTFELPHRCLVVTAGPMKMLLKEVKKRVRNRTALESVERISTAREMRKC